MTRTRRFGGVIALVVLVGALVWWFGAGLLTAPILWTMGHPVVVIGVLAGVAILAILIRADRLKDRGKKAKDAEAERLEELARRLMRTGGIALLVGVVVVGLGAFLLPWAKDRQLADSYATGDTVPSYRDRAPFVVANQLSNRDLDEIIGDRVGVHAVQSAEQPNQYTTLVVRRGWFQGYEAVQEIRPPLVGASGRASSACRFDGDDRLRLGGGAPSNNLGRAISFQRPFAFWDEGDSYGFCDGDVPVAVVPLQRWGGVWPVMTPHPAGVAVYRDGELTVHDPDAVPDDVIGPTYPRSIAARQRDASTALGTLADWVFNRVGFDTAGEGSDDEEPNRGNAVDFSLVDTDGRGEYVTALTPVGNSESVVAAGHVDNRMRGPGHNPYVVSRYPEPLPALSTSENRIRSDFNHLPGWASGMRVMEMTPSEDGTYVASIGQNQVVTYRALIDTDGSVRLLDRDDDTPDADELPGDVGADPSTMSTRELVEAIERLTEELASRADGD